MCRAKIGNIVRAGLRGAYGGPYPFVAKTGHVVRIAALGGPYGRPRVRFGLKSAASCGSRLLGVRTADRAYVSAPNRPRRTDRASWGSVQSTARTVRTQIGRVVRIAPFGGPYGRPRVRFGSKSATSYGSRLLGARATGAYVSAPNRPRRTDRVSRGSVRPTARTALERPSGAPSADKKVSREGFEPTISRMKCGRLFHRAKATEVPRGGRCPDTSTPTVRSNNLSAHPCFPIFTKQGCVTWWETKGTPLGTGGLPRPYPAVPDQHVALLEQAGCFVALCRSRVALRPGTHEAADARSGCVSRLPNRRGED